MPAGAHPVDDGTTYRWVSPPHARLTDNVAPEGRTYIFPVGSDLQALWTPDLQLRVVWGKGGLGPAEATLDVQPLDPGRFAPLPRGVEPNGNAYRIELSPGTRIREGRVFLAVPTPPTKTYFSVDGRAWRPLPPTDTEDGIAGGVLARDGYVLAGSSHRDGGASAWPTPVVVAVGAAAAALLLLTLWSWRRRRRNAVAALVRAGGVTSMSVLPPTRGTESGT